MVTNEILAKFLLRVDEIGGKSQELIFEKPATKSAIKAVEKELAYALPVDFRNCLLTVSAHCEFRWFLPENFCLPEQLKQIFGGELHWGIEFITPFNQHKDEWVRKVLRWSNQTGQSWDVV